MKKILLFNLLIIFILAISCQNYKLISFNNVNNSYFNNDTLSKNGLWFESFIDDFGKEKFRIVKYKNNNKIGKEIILYKDGWTVNSYKKGLLHGYSISYSKDGKVINKIKYKNGKLINIGGVSF